MNYGITALCRYVKVRLWMTATILVFGSVMTSCSDSYDTAAPAVTDAVEAQLQQMTLREKVGQMFYVRPESLDPNITTREFANLKLQEVNQAMKDLNANYPVGGIILYAHNIEDETQLATFVSQIRALNGTPLLCIDEEGGRVARIANNDNFDVEDYISMESIGETGDPTAAYLCGNTIGTYLHQYGFDIDFAPVADVNTNPENIRIGTRAFSDNPYVAAPMVTSYLAGLQDAGVEGCIKHFPGHGDTKADTHYGYAQSLKTWDEILNCEMIPFKAGIRYGCQLVMTAHISLPNVTGAEMPATMSSLILQDKLRGELGYQNIIIADALEMGAITQQYGSEDAAIRGIQAGLDIMLNPLYFTKAFDAVVNAVETGVISEQRINESVRRILKLKQQLRFPTPQPTDTKPLEEWQAGSIVSEASILAFGGIDRCFAAEPIPDGVWARMQGKTYKENPYIGRDDLRHIRTLHWDYDQKIHIGEMIVNAQIADRVVAIFRQLFEAKYPIQRMLLPDEYDADDETQMRDNNSSSFCYRAIAGSTKLSKHARGLAIDINTLYNPYYKDREDGSRFVQPATATTFCDRTWAFPYQIEKDDLCYKLFIAAGFEWGGEWTSCKDYQHFELIE